MLFIALLLLGFFVAFQGLAIDKPNFLNLMFWSFICLGAGTFLTITTFAKSTEAEKYLCLGVVIVFIVATLFVANSLAQVPRGGAQESTDITLESFNLVANGSGNRLSARYSQILHSADYPVALVRIRTLYLGETIRISRTQSRDPVNVTLYFSLSLKPYQRNVAPFKHILTFNEGQRQAYLESPIWLEWGTTSPANRTRFEEYDLELWTLIRVEGRNLEPMNFRLDMPEFRMQINEYVVDSKFQNGLSITLSGIFIGINCYIPISLVSKLWSRKLLEKRMRETETNS